LGSPLNRINRHTGGKGHTAKKGQYKSLHSMIPVL
jgi:hypothetical protein